MKRRTLNGEEGVVGVGADGAQATANQSIRTSRHQLTSAMRDRVMPPIIALFAVQYKRDAGLSCRIGRGALQ